MRLTAALIFALPLLMSACIQPEPVVVPEPTPEPIIVCDATPFQHLVGGPIEGTDEIDFPGTLRIVGPDDFLTKDYDIRRLTVTTRRDSRDKLTVGRIFCG